MHNTILLTFVAAVTALAVLALLQSGFSSGPNCPGMDPSWLGWCD